jgi:GTPase
MSLSRTAIKARPIRDREVIISDTVGFIKNLPKDLLLAFRATLEEPEDADLLLQVIDISNPRFEEQMAVVENLLQDLELSHIPMTRVFNKIDLVSEEYVRTQCDRYQAVAISALKNETLGELLLEIDQKVGTRTKGENVRTEEDLKDPN